METKHDFPTWRAYLGHLIKNSQEKQRLAREARVTDVTLKRWSTGESQPREENLRRLIHALVPEIAAPFLRLVQVEFPSFTHEDVERKDIVPEISPALYAQVMRTYAKTPAVLAQDTLYRLIFEEALAQLDPEKAGLSLALVCCVEPPPGQKVRCLRQTRGMGTPPWERELERKTMLLGSESVAGNAVMNYRLAAVESRDSPSFTPANWTPHEQSAIASPILRQARVAGALLASASRPHFFTQAHQELLELYAPLTALMFEPHEFYDPADIMLGVMPDFELQEPVFANFEQRVTRKFAEAAPEKREMTLPLAHRLVWHDIAEELLRVASRK